MRGLLVGRFQPFHRGHLSVIRWAQKHHPGEPLLLGIGSAQESHTWANPFTAGERWEMIERAASEEKIVGVLPVPVPDIQRHAQWVAYLASLLPRFERVYANNPLTLMLFEEAGYAVETPPLEHRERWQGSLLRAAIASGQLWEDAVPPSVRGYLAEIKGVERIRLLAPTPTLNKKG